MELPSGGSFAIAGLLQHTTKQVLDAFPGLKDMPVLGALFRSRDFQNDETELVVIVSAYLVEPTTAKKLASPTDGFMRAERRGDSRLRQAEPHHQQQRSARTETGRRRQSRLYRGVATMVTQNGLRIASLLAVLLAGSCSEFNADDQPTQLSEDRCREPSDHRGARLSCAQIARLARRCRRATRPISRPSSTII